MLFAWTWTTWSYQQPKKFSFKLPYVGASMGVNLLKFHRPTLAQPPLPLQIRWIGPVSSSPAQPPLPLQIRWIGPVSSSPAQPCEWLSSIFSFIPGHWIHQQKNLPISLDPAVFMQNGFRLKLLKREIIRFSWYS
jgi:hypothetical protein